MTDLIDRPKEIRAGEEIDVARLTAFLQEHLPEARGSEIVVQQFPSGHSNLTYFVRAGEREYVLRRPPFGSKVKSAHDMNREYRILSKLHAVYPLAPEPVVFCDDTSVIGANFYMMRRLEGVIIRRQLPEGLVLEGEQLRTLHRNLVDNLARIHAIDYAAAGLDDLGKPEGYVERQVTGWTKRYADSQTDEIPAVDEVAKWLASSRPAESRAALIHNDYKLDNVVLDANDITKIVGVLDWEMSTLGDPLMDLGTLLGYWIEAADDDNMKVMQWGPTMQPGSFTRADIVARYEESAGLTIANPVYYYVFGMFKTAVVLQQIYYRFKQGLTKDDRFGMLIVGVHMLVNKAAHHIALGKV